jgi:hypothetical protein
VASLDSALSALDVLLGMGGDATMSKKYFAKLLRGILRIITVRHPEYLDIVVYDDEIYQPHFGLLFEMTIDCLENEPIEEKDQ